MAEKGFLSLPDDEAKKRLAKLGGKSIKMLLNAISGGLGGDVLEMAYDYLKDYLRDKQERRAKALNALLEKTSPKVKEVLDSPVASEPLLDVFLSVLRECLQDDEDEKVAYYAALMAGFASPEGATLTKYQKMAMLNAVRNLRVHDLFVFVLLGSTYSVSHSTDVTLDEMKKHPHAAVSGSIDWDLVPQALSSLMSYGLIKDDVKQITATVPQPNRYHLENLGKTLWKKMSPHLVKLS